MPERFKELKRAVIKEEYVAITGSAERAVVLNQMLYWSERVRDFDKFVREENEISQLSGAEPRPLLNGWFYKTAQQLVEETMLGIDTRTMRKHISWLVDSGLIRQRTNPENKWDKTLQYRVNLKAISSALAQKGYELQGYRKVVCDQDSAILENGISERAKTYTSKAQKCTFDGEKNVVAIPKITTETTTEKEQSPDGDCKARKSTRKMKPFKPPTVDEIRAYVKEKNVSIDPVAFYDYFEAGDWFDSEGKPVLNWKQRVLTWSRMQKERKPTQTTAYRSNKPFTYDYSDTEGSL